MYLKASLHEPQNTLITATPKNFVYNCLRVSTSKISHHQQWDTFLTKKYKLLIVIF